MPADPKHVKSIFLAAAEKGPDERAAFPDGACGSDEELRRRAEELLRAHDEPGGLAGVPDRDTPTGAERTPIVSTNARRMKSESEHGRDGGKLRLCNFSSPISSMKLRRLA